MDTKVIIRILLLLFIGFSASAQSPNLNVAVKFQIQSTTGSDPYTIQGIVTDDLGRWTGSDIAVNDSIYVIEGSELYVLAITAINSVVGPTINITANDPLNAGISISTGQGAIVRPTTNNKYPTYISGLRDDLRSMMQNRLSQLLDKVSAQITDYVGIAGVAPAVSASANTGETWRNSVGELYRSNGTIWINIGASSNIDQTGVADGDGLGYSTVGAVFIPKKFIEGSGTSPAIPKYNASNVNGIVPSQLYELGGKIGVRDATPSYSIDITGVGIANRTIGMNGLPLIYLPAQDTFVESIFIGGGGRKMTNVSVGQGYRNTAFGIHALDSVTNGYGTVALGPYAGQRIKTGFDHTLLGNGAGRSLEGGDDDVAVGVNALRDALNISNSLGIGGDAGMHILTGGNFVAVGNEAFRFYGLGASTNFVTGPVTSSIGIGHRVRTAAISSNNEIVIGYEALGNGDHSVVIGNDSITSTLLQGKVSTHGNRTPISWLDVTGSEAPSVTGTENLLTLRRTNRSSSTYAETAKFLLGKSSLPNRLGSFDPMTKLTIALNRQTASSPSVVISDVNILTLTDGGFVGIGDTAPLAPLHIGNRPGGEPTYRGDIVINQAAVDGTNGGVEWKSDASAAGFGYRLTSVFNVGTSSYDFWLMSRSNNATWTGRIFWNAAGEMGMGSAAASPTARLDLAQGTIRLRDFTTNGNIIGHNGSGVLASVTPASIVTAGGGATAAGANGQMAYFTGTSSIASKPEFVADLTNNRFGVGVTPSFRLDVGGTANTSQRKIGINNVQMLYLPDQSASVFRGSLFVGNGGASLSHTTGEEGQYNVGVGINALNAITSGNGNHAIGYNALLSNTTGYYNIATGIGALASNLTGHNNLALGTYALSTNQSGIYNIAFGLESLLNATGSNNFALGAFTLRDLTSGTNNMAVGYNTARGITTGSNNILYGNSLSSLPTNLNNAVIIGSSITGLGTLANNTVLIADGAGNRRITVLSSGFTGINTVAPAQMLHVAGNARVNGSMRSDSMLEVYGTETTALGVRLRNPTATNGRVWDFRSKDNGRLDLTRDNSVNVMSSWRFNDFYQRGSGFFGPVITSIEAPLVVGVDSTASDVRIGVENKGITSGSHAVVQLRTATGFGDPKIIFRDVSAVAGYIGADASDGMKIKVGYGSDVVGSNTQMIFQQDGIYFSTAKHDLVIVTSGSPYQAAGGSNTYQIASGTTDFNLPEIVSGTPGANQVTVGYHIKIANPTGVSVTVATTGSDLIWSASSVTLLTVSTLKLTAISANQWSID